MKITRDVIVDLWPVYQSKEASADTRALVDEFLTQDAALARTLREEDSLPALEPVPLALAPDHETRAFEKTRRKTLFLNFDMFLFLAIMFSCFAFGRIVSDTSWDVSPRNFIVVASIAGVFWITFFVRIVSRLSRSKVR